MAHFVAFCIGFQKNIPLQNPPGGKGGGIWQLKVYFLLYQCPSYPPAFYINLTPPPPHVFVFFASLRHTLLLFCASYPPPPPQFIFATFRTPDFSQPPLQFSLLYPRKLVSCVVLSASDTGNSHERVEKSLPL